MIDLLGVTALLLLAALGSWLALRAFRARSRMLKWVGLPLSALLALVGAVALVVALAGFYKVNFPPYKGTATGIKVAGTPEQVARGARFAGGAAPPTAPAPPPPAAVAARAGGHRRGWGGSVACFRGARAPQGEILPGGRPDAPAPPAGPDLTVYLAKWTAEEFSRTV